MTFGAEDFQREMGVSHETLERLKIYAELLTRWQKRMNLVGPSTMDDLWRRHFLDSAQLWPLVQAARSDLEAPVWLDLGAGAGFPGLVLALIGAGPVHLVESNARKCVFLRQVIRETGAAAEVHETRIEDLAPFPVDLITARALASLSRLVELAQPFVGENTEMWFLKGQDVEKELTEATISRTMRVENFFSRTDSAGTIVRMREG